MKFTVVLFVVFVTSLTMAYPSWPGLNLKHLEGKAEAEAKDGPKSALDDVIGGPKQALAKYIPTASDVTETVGSKSGWSSFLQLIFDLFLKLFMPSVPGADSVPGVSTAVEALSGLTG